MSFGPFASPPIVGLRSLNEMSLNLIKSGVKPKWREPTNLSAELYAIDLPRIVNVATGASQYGGRSNLLTASQKVYCQSKQYEIRQSASPLKAACNTTA